MEANRPLSERLRIWCTGRGLCCKLLGAIVTFGLGALLPTHAAATYVQGNYADPQTDQSSVPVTYTSAQTAGNTNIVVVSWWNTTATANLTSLVDSKGNTYVLALGPTSNPTIKAMQSIYYAKNIVAAAAGTNTVTATFSVAAHFVDIRITQYSGLNATNPFDIGAGAFGTATTADSGAITTSFANELVVGASVIAQDDGVGTGYTLRIKPVPDADIVEDKSVTAIGSYNATVAIYGGGGWVMQVAAFRIAGTDTTLPSAPSGLTATVVSATQINLSWTAATDNVGVTGYKVERCQGASCTAFAQISTPTTTTYSDTGLTASTSYSYRVRATDAGANLGPYSISSSATTSASGGDTTPPTAPAGLTTTSISSSQINLSWTASTDNVGVTGYRVERCAGASCTTFAQIATPTATTYSDTGLAASTSYSYRVRATDAAGNLSTYSGTSTASTLAAGDTIPPTAPTSPAAVAASSTQINLSWTASTDNIGVTGYRVERCAGVSCTTFAQIATPTGTTYSDTGLTSSTSYSYRVRAADAAGNLSAYSSTASAVTTADTTAPTAPTALSASAISSTAINLSWTASTDNVGVTGYRVERCAGASCTTFAQIATPTTTTYSDTGLAASTSYTYRVRATDAAANLSAYSSTATTITLPPTNSTYQYDSHGRLLNITTVGQGIVTHSYDAAGNLVGIVTTP